MAFAKIGGACLSAGQLKSEMPQATVVIADDHPIILTGLGMLIDADPDLDLVGQATNGADALDMICERRPQIAVLDISLPKIDGLDVTRRLRECGSPTSILMLTQHEDRAHLRQALDAGARGYVLKRSAALSMAGAIRGVLVGGLYVDPLMADQIFPPLGARRRDASPAQLTPREIDVLKNVAAGKTARQIAAELDLSVSTIETYKMRAWEKLDIGSRAELVSFASSQGWFANL